MTADSPFPDLKSSATSRVLLLGRSEMEAEQIGGLLRNSAVLSFEVDHAGSLGDAANLPDPKKVDVVIILPSADDIEGFGQLARVGMTFPDSAIVVVSSTATQQANCPNCRR